MQKITLSWMDRIRHRLNEEKFKDSEIVNEFIKPIMDYGNSEEERITKAFEKDFEEMKLQN